MNNILKMIDNYRGMRTWRQRAVDAEDLIKYYEKVIRELQKEIKGLKEGGP